MRKEKQYCLLAMVGSIFYAWCSVSHWCIGGHLAHEVRVLDWVNDLSWIVAFAFGIVLLWKAGPPCRYLSYLLIAAILFIPFGFFMAPAVFLYSLSLMLRMPAKPVAKPDIHTEPPAFHAPIPEKLVAVVLIPIPLLFALSLFWIKAIALLAMYLLSVVLWAVIRQQRYEKKQKQQSDANG